MARRTLIGLSAVAFALTVATPAAVAAPRSLKPAAAANRCVSVRPVAARRPVLRVFVKPTGLGRAMLFDRSERLLAAGGGAAVDRVAKPEPSVEWALRSFGRRGMAIRSVPTGRWLAADGGSFVTAPRRTRRALFRVRRARGCPPYPEAELNATGRPFRGPRTGPVVGLADPHMHVTAELRAGGLVIAGSSYDRFGITEALGRDVDVHGEDGGMDITGNLLRSGSPTGTHDIHGWPTFAGWPTFDTYTHHQAYYRWLERARLAGLRLVGAMIVEDEPLCTIEPRKSHSCDETATAELQMERLRGLQDYVDAQSGGRGRGWLRLVESPAEARRAIRAGKLAVVVGFESSNPFGCHERQGQPQCGGMEIDRGIEHLWRLGIRSLFVAHWVDNALSGAALEGGDKGTFIAAMQASHTGRPFVTGDCPHPGQGEEPAVTGPVVGRQCNTKGLTDLGDHAVRRLMDRGMLIEVDHLSEWARDRVLAIAEERRYPLVSSHTGTGGTWDPSELRRLFAAGGFATATLDAAAKLPEKILGFREHGASTVGLATDTGGFAALPAPAGDQPLAYPFRSYDRRVEFGRQRTGERVFDLNTDGMAHYGLLPDLLALMQAQPRGGEALSALFGSAEAYLRMWERTGA